MDTFLFLGFLPFFGCSLCLRLFEPHVLVAPNCFILVSFTYVFLPGDSVFSGKVFFKGLQQEKQIGQSISCFYPLELSLNKPQRKSFRGGLMHMRPCPHM